MPYLLGTQARMRTSEISAKEGTANAVQLQVPTSRCRFDILAPFCCLVPALVKKASCAWRAMFHSSSSYLILAIVQILQLSCRADAGTINDPPNNLTVNLGEIATFSCTATGSRTLWYINNTLYSTHNHTEGIFEFTEIRTVTAEHDIFTHSMTVRFNATELYNGTKINCGVLIDRINRSPPAIITIRGGPATPELSLTPASRSELLLSWSESFSWSDVPVTSYTVSIDPPINENSSWTVPRHPRRFTFSSDQPSLCRHHRFTVEAVNELGSSKPGIISGGFPIAPTVPATVTILDVTFSKQLKPIATIELTLPTVCDYQEVEYVVTLSEVGHNSSVLAQDSVLGPSQPIHISVDDKVQLVMNKIYQVVVAMTLPGLEESYQPQPLTTVINTKVDEEKQTTLSSSNMGFPVTKGLTRTTSTGLSMNLLVLICSVAGALAVCVLILAIIILLIYQHKKRQSRSFRSSGTKSPTTPPMVSNPIYEGQPVYETIDPQFRLPMPLPPVNTSIGTCPSPLESPYKNDISPYSNCPQVLQFTTTLEEGYTIMASAREESKNNESQNESHSSGSEPESSDMARYVPDPSLQYASEC